MPERPPEIPTKCLRDLVGWLKAERVPGVIIGGIAVSILSKPRTTKDVDALIQLDDSRLPDFLKSGRGYGFVPRIPGAVKFAREHRVFLIRHRLSQTDVDVILGGMEYERTIIKQSRRIRVGEFWIRVPRPEDLPQDGRRQAPGSG